MPDLQEVFLQARLRFDRQAAEGLEACFQITIPDAGDCYLVVSDSQCFLNEGISDSPTVILTMDLQTLIDVLSGTVNGMQAFMFGRIKADGDMAHATKLSELFPLQKT
ncbi:SCP2 sterol-binding domain-containing protein [Aestuariicella hydrocarbonica]|uniref:SCP2 sterol-binding domain-containing protein n=1 Tax=Pseudomaricurvus hydrocarbonicus TaxID=1470433 RepID=A0A9E5JRK1_9GAMM|nr:SCP2 sterol-binding domain-containing protein [Aestuariicella hydrocarbonica]NHO65472.1 SCP2 sterol-binding domain-containing protein [Aestuariicella hydrocarbonica]